MGLQHTEASRNAVCTSEALPPNKATARPSEEAQPTLCRTLPSTGLPGGLVSPQARWSGPPQHGSTTASRQESLSGEDGAGGSVPTGGAPPP